MIVLTRIDDRLIHGQVVEGWVNHLKASCIIVADDAAASNPLQRSIMELSVPRGLKIVIGGIEEVCERLHSGALDAERIILLFSRPADVLRAFMQRLTCSSVNIGGMHFIPGKRKLLDVLSVNDADIEALRKIATRGIPVAVQAVPTGKPVPLEKVCKECGDAGTPR